MAASPIFVGIPRHECGYANTTSTSRDTNAPTGVVDIFTAGASGSRIDKISVKILSTVNVASGVWIWIKKSSNYYLLEEIVLAAPGTVGATVEAGEVSNYYPEGIIIPSGAIVAATVSLGTQMANVHIFGGDF